MYSRSSWSFGSLPHACSSGLSGFIHGIRDPLPGSLFSWILPTLSGSKKSLSTGWKDGASGRVLAAPDATVQPQRAWGGAASEARWESNSFPHVLRPRRPLPSRVPAPALSPSSCNQGRLEGKGEIKPRSHLPACRALPSVLWQEGPGLRQNFGCAPPVRCCFGRPRLRGRRGAGSRAGDPVSAAPSGLASARTVACCCWRREPSRGCFWFPAEFMVVSGERPS